MNDAKERIAALVLFACVITVFSQGCSINGLGFKRIKGSGKVISEDRTVSGFSEISLSGSGKIIITQGDKEALKIEAEDNIIPYLNTTVRGDVLRLRSKQGVSLSPTKPIIYHVTLKDLKKLSISGSGDVKCEKLETRALEISISGSADVDMGITAESLVSGSSGSGTFHLRGKVDSQTVKFSGSGKYHAKDLESKKAEVRISGSGDVVLDVSESLDVGISGSGDVTYTGDPDVEQNISGSGHIKKISE